MNNPDERLIDTLVPPPRPNIRPMMTEHQFRRNVRIAVLQVIGGLSAVVSFFLLLSRLLANS